jgi:hypothetical protein
MRPVVSWRPAGVTAAVRWEKKISIFSLTFTLIIVVGTIQSLPAPCLIPGGGSRSTFPSNWLQDSFQLQVQVNHQKSVVNDICVTFAVT